MALEIGFWAMAVVAVAAALAVVLLRDIFRAALSLVLCFVAVAGIYVTLSAGFLAAVQVLVYVGAIAILLMLAIMLTRDLQHGSPMNRLSVPAFVVALGFLGTVIYAVFNTPWRLSAQAPLEATTAALAGRLFGESGHIIAVEIAAALLLAAVLGAVVLVRER